MDFEATCWNDSTARSSSEIIEFPAVLLNVNTHEIEAIYHHYVQPINKPKLSDFCKDLTGITQDQVDGGMPLATCLLFFRRWLDKLARTKNVHLYGLQINGDANCKNGAFVTWSDWDIGVCLYYECKRKQIKLPVEFSQWINVRALYKRFYDRKPRGLNGSMEDVGIKFAGREHSGINDAKNTAKLCSKMIRDGCLFDITSRIADIEKTGKLIVSNPTSCHSTNEKCFNTNKISNKSSHESQCIYDKQQDRTDKISDINPERKTITHDENNDCATTSNHRSTSKFTSKCTQNCLTSDCNVQVSQTLLSKVHTKGKDQSILNDKDHKKSNSKCLISPKTMLSERNCIYSSMIKPAEYHGVNLMRSSATNATPVLTNSTNILKPIETSPLQFVIESRIIGKPPSPFNCNSPMTVNMNVDHCSNIAYACKLRTSKSSKNTTKTSCSGICPFVADENIVLTKQPISPQVCNAHSTTSRIEISSKASGSSLDITPQRSIQCGYDAGNSMYKRTSPLCYCGKRARRCLANTPGPNEGRVFYSCAMKVGGSIQDTNYMKSTTRKRRRIAGCDYFLWDAP